MDAAKLVLIFIDGHGIGHAYLEHILFLFILSTILLLSKQWKSLELSPPTHPPL